MGIRGFALKSAVAVAALTVSSTAALAAPAPTSSTLVPLSDQQLDTVQAGGGMWGGVVISCSFGISCNGNGGNGNGNSIGLVNILTGNGAGASIGSGNTVLVFRGFGGTV